MSHSCLCDDDGDPWNSPLENAPGLSRDHIVVLLGLLIELHVGHSIGFTQAWKVLHQDKAESIIPVLRHASVVMLKCEAGRGPVQLVGV